MILMPLENGKTYRIQMSDKLSVLVQKIGKEHRIWKEDSPETVYTIKKSFASPDTHSLETLTALLGSSKMVADFQAAVAQVSQVAYDTGASGEEFRYSLAAGETKDGKLLYEKINTAMYASERVIRGHKDNTVFNQIYISLYMDDGSITTVDMTSGDFTWTIITEVTKIQGMTKLKGKEVPTAGDVERCRKNIIALANAVCKSYDKVPTGIRFLGLDGNVYYDLNNNESIEVSANGVRKVEPVSGFLRPAGFKPATEPDLGATLTDLFKLLAPRLPMRGVDQLKHIAWLLSMNFRDYMGYSVKAYGLLMLGPSSIGKTTGTQYFLDILDPGIDHVIAAAVATNPKDLVLRLTSGKMTVLDNFGMAMNSDLSQTLCNCYDGIPLEVRELYTDSGIVHLQPKTMPMITALGDIKGWGPDLNTRFLIVRAEMGAAKDRMTDIAVRQYYNKHAAQLIGGYLNGLSAILSKFQDTCDYVQTLAVNPRLVPILAVQEIILEALGITKGLAVKAAMEESQNTLYQVAKRDRVCCRIAEVIEARNSTASNTPTDTRGERPAWKQQKLNANGVDAMTLNEWTQVLGVTDDENRLVGPGYIHQVFKSSGDKLRALGVYVRYDDEATEPDVYEIRYDEPPKFGLTYTRQLNQEIARKLGEADNGDA